MAKRGKRVHEGNAYFRDYIAMTIPLLLMSFFYYGPRVLALALVAVITARIADRFAALLRGRRYDKTENSSTFFALVLVLMMPVSVRYLVVVAAVLVTVFVGKEAFGGYMSYPFNPSAVGFCVAAVSWPAEVLTYPAPAKWMFAPPQNFEQFKALMNFTDTARVEGLSMTLKNGGLPKTDFFSLLLGDYPGAIGVTCNVVILSCVVYLLARKRINLVAPAAFLATAILIAFFFPRYSEIGWQTFPYDIMVRLQVVKYELLGGAFLFSAIFMVPEPGTLPKNTISRLIYGFLLGLATMMFRYYGTFELGVCFAFLLVNAISGYFDRAIAAGQLSRREVARE